MALTTLTATLYETPVVDPKTGLLGPEWQRYLRNLDNSVLAGPSRVVTVAPTTDFDDSIPPTAIPTTVPLTAGVYRVTVYAKVNTPATTGAATSDLAADMTWTHNGNTCTHTLFSGMNGNTVTTTAGGTYTVQIDGSTPILYATTYASDAANEMQYRFVLCLEALS